MLLRYRSAHRERPSLFFGVLSILMVVLCVAGGASRPDVLGQAMVRMAAGVALCVTFLSVDHRQIDVPKPVLFLLLATIALPLLQLLPLPPALWSGLAGREIFRQAVTGYQPWRPLSIEPGATVNAVASLLIPAAVLALISGVRPTEMPRVIVIVLTAIAISAIIGLMQLSGMGVTNPFVNDTPGAVSGLFANRNHFALFLALGCLIAPVWASQNQRQASWRIPFALGLAIFFLMLILASGSRAGILSGVIGTLIGLGMIRKELYRILRCVPRWVAWAIVAAVLIGVATLIWLAIASDRAASVDRVVALSSSEDMRTRALPTVMSMIGTYLPFGTGFGSFDTAFRIHEPFALLKLTYFNHAHNDFLEIVLEGGVPGAILLAAALGWWIFASIRVWRRPHDEGATLGRLGSAVLLLIIIASVFDYPARTPLMMAIIILAAFWLGSRPLARV